MQQRRAHQGGRLLLDRDAVARGESESVTALHPERYCSVRGLAPRGRVSVAAGAEEDNNNMAGSGGVLVERLEVIGGVIGMLTKREGLIFNLKFWNCWTNTEAAVTIRTRTRTGSSPR